MNENSFTRGQRLTTLFHIVCLWKTYLSKVFHTITIKHSIHCSPNLLLLTITIKPSPFTRKKICLWWLKLKSYYTNLYWLKLEWKKNVIPFCSCWNIPKKVFISRQTLKMRLILLSMLLFGVFLVHHNWIKYQ